MFDTNIEIISACNNTCEFCYQKHKHNSGKILSYEEIKEIIDWVSPETFIEISGGEPTLHPDILKILKYSLDKNYTVLFTNLLCDTSLVEKILEFSYFRWAINVNYRDELSGLFWENFSLICKNIEKVNKNKQSFTFLIPISGEVQKDKERIDKLSELLKKGCSLPKEIQIELCRDLNEKILPIDLSESLSLLFDVVEKDFDNIEMKFKCAIDFCSVNSDVIARIIKYGKCSVAGACMREKVFVTVDKEAKFCRLCENNFLTVKSYKIFQDSKACAGWLKEESVMYMSKHEKYCREMLNGKCYNNICLGTCPVVNEAIRRQNNYSLTRLI